METNIRNSQWEGVYWPRWSDAVAEAGLKPNALQTRHDSEEILLKVVEACRHYGTVPSSAQIRMYARSNPSFPSHTTVSRHFSKTKLVAALGTFARQNAGFDDVAAMLPIAPTDQTITEPRHINGHVYLFKSGDHYKIGRSIDLERRIKEVRVALPEAVTIVHTITTDDPSGIEAYWHKRFADRRANGEWFKLSAPDVAAFRRRKYQ